MSLVYSRSCNTSTRARWTATTLQEPVRYLLWEREPAPMSGCYRYHRIPLFWTPLPEVSRVHFITKYLHSTVVISRPMVMERYKVFGVEACADKIHTRLLTHLSRQSHTGKVRIVHSTKCSRRHSIVIHKSACWPPDTTHVLPYCRPSPVAS